MEQIVSGLIGASLSAFLIIVGVLLHKVLTDDATLSEQVTLEPDNESLQNRISSETVIHDREADVTKIIRRFRKRYEVSENVETLSQRLDELQESILKGEIITALSDEAKADIAVLVHEKIMNMVPRPEQRRKAYKPTIRLRFKPESNRVNVGRLRPSGGYAYDIEDYVVKLSELDMLQRNEICTQLRDYLNISETDTIEIYNASGIDNYKRTPVTAERQRAGTITDPPLRLVDKYVFTCIGDEVQISYWDESGTCTYNSGFRPIDPIDKPALQSGEVTLEMREKYALLRREVPCEVIWA